MKKFILIVFFIAVANFCYAEDVFIANTGAGLNDGASCANAHSASWFNTAGNWGGGVGEIDPGDTVHLCGTISTPLTIQASGTAGNNITVKFENNAKMSAGIWGGTGTGAITCSSLNYIVIDGGTNGAIEATANGVGLANQVHNYGINSVSCSNIEVKNLIITNTFQRNFGSDENNYGIGIRFSSGSNVSIHNNAVSESNTGIKYIYGGSNSSVSIYNNDITEVSNGVMIGDTGDGATINGLSIYGNKINLGQSWGGKFASGDAHHADGIQIDTNFVNSDLNNAKVYGNTLGPVWPMKIIGVESATTAPIYIEYYTDVDIINNLVLANGTTWLTNPAYTCGSYTGHSCNVMNNTFISTGGRNSCFKVGYSSIAKNNLCIDVGTGAQIEGIVSPSQIDYNVYTTIDDGFYGSGLGTYNWTSWRAAGYDAHSKNAMPTFAETTYYRLASGDTVGMNSGTSLSSYFSVDKDGAPRPQGAAWDIGAYEGGTGTFLQNPKPPSQIIIQ